MPANVVLPPELIDAVVAGACEGHRIVAKSHIEEEGWDSTTFGFNRYRVSWNWISRFLDEVDGVEVIDRTTCLRARWADYEIGFYNGGIGSDWDPDTFDFDATARRAQVGFANMDALPGLGVETTLTNLLVVYTGSTERGCVDIYLGAPITNPISRRASWEWIEKIWSAPESDDRPSGENGGQFRPFRDLDPGGHRLDLRDEPGVDDSDADAGSHG